MRIWTLHPSYLDRRGLVALWREALLAQAVLRGRTRGYTQHSQLLRFRAQARPVGCIASYLRVVQAEGASRGYKFAFEKISRARHSRRILVSRGQLEYEWRHLQRKLAHRDPEWLARIGEPSLPRPHPLFRVVPGSVEEWERVASPLNSASGGPGKRAGGL